MTAQKYSDKRVPRHYFAFLLRQNWPALVTNAIVLLLLNVVSLSMSLSDMYSLYTPLNIDKYLPSLLSEYRAVNVVFASLLAVLWGCTTMSYLNSKVGVNFHHSLPLTRESHYFKECGAKITLFALPLFVSNLLGYFTTAAITGRFGAEVYVVFLQSVLYSLTYFLLFYTIMIFAASFTGTLFGRILAGGMIVFMPTILLWCFYYICDFSAIYSSFTWIENIAERILLPARAILVAGHDTGINVTGEIIGALILAAVFLFFGVLIYKRRKSELSGTPVLSSVARGLMKYATIFVSATLFAIAMEDFADGYIGIYIGGAIGTLLAAMLMNTILTKSAKKMFAGVRGLVISCLAFFVVFTVFGFDLIGFDTYVPAPLSVRTVTVQIGGIEVELTDDDDVERVTEIVRTYFKDELDHSNGYETLNTVAKDKYYDLEDISVREALELNMLVDTSNMMTNSMYVRVAFKTVGGLRFDKRYSAPLVGSHEEILTIMANSEGFLDAYFGKSATYVGTGWIEMPLNDYSDSQKINETYARELWYNMRVSYNGIEYFNRPMIATVTLEGTPSYRYPYYDGSEDAIYRYMRLLTSVYIVNAKTGEMREYTDPAEMEMILRAGVLNEGSVAQFTPKDDTYTFFGVMGDKINQRYICGYFLDGHVPALPMP